MQFIACIMICIEFFFYVKEMIPFISNSCLNQTLAIFFPTLQLHKLSSLLGKKKGHFFLGCKSVIQSFKIPIRHVIKVSVQQPVASRESVAPTVNVQGIRVQCRTPYKVDLHKRNECENQAWKATSPPLSLNFTILQTCSCTI